MGNIVIIMGKSGTGKSTSLKTLDPKTSYIINCLGKKLPFKGSSKIFDESLKNLKNTSDFEKITALIENISAKVPRIKNIVIDDASYIMRDEFFARAKERGYDKFVEVAVHMQKIITAAKDARPDLNVFLMFHSDELQDSGSIVEYKVATIGKMLDEKYNPIEVVPVVLYSSVKFNDNKQPEYGFYTHRTKEGNVIIPAKSPDSMFEDDFIPNDLGEVIKKMEAYY